MAMVFFLSGIVLCRERHAGIMRRRRRARFHEQRRLRGGSQPVGRRRPRGLALVPQVPGTLLRWWGLRRNMPGRPCRARRERERQLHPPRDHLRRGRPPERMALVPKVLRSVLWWRKFIRQMSRRVGARRKRI